MKRPFFFKKRKNNYPKLVPIKKQCHTYLSFHYFVLGIIILYFDAYVSKSEANHNVLHLEFDFIVTYISSHCIVPGLILFMF